MATLLNFLCSKRHIDANKDKYIATLREAVAIKSVSAWPDARPECQKMMDWAQKKLEAIGATIEQVDVGSQTLPDGRTLKLPNVIMGVLGNVSRAKLCSRPQKTIENFMIAAYLECYHTNNSNNNCLLVNDLWENFNSHKRCRCRNFAQFNLHCFD